jgi:hypothetical protein
MLAKASTHEHQKPKTTNNSALLALFVHSTLANQG